MPSKKFSALQSRVAGEYRARGYSAERARKIGTAVAGRVATIRHRKYGNPPAVERRQACMRRELGGRTFGSREAQRRAFTAATHNCAEQAKRPARRRAAG